MPEFHMRSTGREHCADEILRRAFPELASHLGRDSSLVFGSQVGAKSIGLRDRLAPGARLEGALDDGSYAAVLRPEDLAPLPEAVIAEGDGWSVLRVPAGWASPFFPAESPVVRQHLAGVMSLQSRGSRFALVPELDTSGLHLVAHSDEEQRRLQALFANGEIELCARAILPAPPWPEGTLSLDGSQPASRCGFRVLDRWDGIAEVELCARGVGFFGVRRELSRVGLPILGDALFGGRMVSGGLRLRVHEIRFETESTPCAIRVDEEGSDPWRSLSEPVFPENVEDRVLEISSGSVRALKRGHPWVIGDERTGDAGRFAPGTRVTLVEARSGREQGSALIEGEGRVAARRWSSSARKGKDDSVEARVAKALRQRQVLFETEGTVLETNAFRLVHGEADGLPGFFADRLAEVLRVQIVGRACLQFAPRAVAALCHGIEKRLGFAPSVVQVIHLRERPTGKLRCVFRSEDAALRGNYDVRGRLLVREEGLRYAVALGLQEPFRSRPGIGLFLDQRENRCRLAEWVRSSGGRWLNLFAHSGAFSVSLLAAGAEEVTSVDLSAPYLQWLEENLRLNQLDSARHRAIRGDGRRILDQLLENEELFDGIVLDPPTAAAAGRKFWSVAREGEVMLGRAFRALRPGGTLLVCRNDRGAAHKLRPWLERCSKNCDMHFEKMAPAPPSFDFPRLKGFPEGDSFGGFLLSLAR